MSVSNLINLLPFNSKDPDKPLVEQAQKGDSKAFDSLRQRHDSNLKGFISRRVGLTSADDVSQEVWIACWKGFTQYAIKTRFKSWLYGIAIHKCADHLRGGGLSRIEPLSDHEPVQEDAYAQVDLKQSVKSALSQLPEPQRDVLELYYYSQLTLKEIALTLNRNPNTVKYQFYRAHESVAANLSENERMNS